MSPWADASRCTSPTSLIRRTAKGLRFANDAKDAAQMAKDDVAWWMARAVELRLIASRGSIDDAPYAMNELLRAAILAPATDPAAIVLIRRYYLETLYLMQDHLVDRFLDGEPGEGDPGLGHFAACMESRITSHEVAHGVLRDAFKLRAARDANGVISLLREFGQASVLGAFSEFTVPPDGVADPDAVQRAMLDVGRR